MALTQHPEGSLRELWKIAFPLMLSSLSVTTMIFVDRLLLAHYASSALNAAANAATFGWSFIFGWMVLTGIAEVFVAQYNGAGQKDKLGEPVWQMIWLSLLSTLFFFPLALWGTQWFYGPEQSMEQEYFSWMVLFGPSFPLYSALCGFFIGQGKTHLVTLLALAANFVNACLDVALIFGVEGYIPSLGVTGAAIGTSCSSIFQVIVLLFIFLNRHHREQYGTGRYQLNRTAFWQCVRIGLPGAIFVVCELLGWTTFYSIMTLLGERYITVASIGQSLVILLFFFSDGVSKAVSTVSGNLIGAKRSFLVPKVIFSGFWLHLLFLAFMLTFFTLYSSQVITEFLPKADPNLIQSLHRPLQVCFFCLSLHLFFEGLKSVFAGVLTAAGDTWFLLVGGGLSVWMFLIMPLYFCMVFMRMPLETAFVICVLYSVSTGSLYMWRVWTGKWQTVSLTTS